MPKIIESNPKVLGGKPVIKGTRIPVARIIALLGMNYTLTDIRNEFPQLSLLTKENLSDILTYYQTKLQYK
jgi:uncharacterized protein (DUF433 family)